jgi:anti-anti-sigma factor
VAEFRVSGVDGTRHISLVGEIDLAVTDEFLTQVRESLAAADHVDLDFGGVTFIDSSGLGALVLLRQEAGQQSKRLSLVNVSPATSRLLRITGLEDAFDVCTEHG